MKSCGRLGGRHFRPRRLRASLRRIVLRPETRSGRRLPGPLHPDPGSPGDFDTYLNRLIRISTRRTRFQDNPRIWSSFQTLFGAVEAGDLLRYMGRRAQELPSHLLQFSADKKPVVVCNVTRRCNLGCLHCYAQATAGPAPDELTIRQPKPAPGPEGLRGAGGPVFGRGTAGAAGPAGTRGPGGRQGHAGGRFHQRHPDQPGPGDAP